MTARAARLLVALALVALVSPWLAPYDPTRLNSDYMHAPPMRPHVLGPSGPAAPFVYPIVLDDRLAQRYRDDRSRTLALPWFESDDEAPVYLLGADSLGRDLLSRLLHGARASLSLALVSMLLAVAIGALLGALAAYRGGWVERWTLRTADFIVVLPFIYVLLLLRQSMPLSPSTATVFAVTAGIFALVGWPFVARGVRGILVVEREREYVLAARALGAPAGRVLIHHLLPSCAGYLTVQATLLLPAFIVAEATLSYAGLGFSDAVPTWGTMLREGANVTALTRFPWTLASGIAIFAVTVVVNSALASDKIGPS